MTEFFCSVETVDRMFLGFPARSRLTGVSGPVKTDDRISLFGSG